LLHTKLIRKQPKNYNILYKNINLPLVTVVLISFEFSAEEKMIEFSSALKIVMDHVPKYGKTETVDINDCINRVLASDISADRPAPPFNRVAMDGYACRKNDIGNELKIVEIVPAGKTAEKFINPGECSKVMTGCPLPDGAEMVFMIEVAVEKNGLVTCTDPEIAKKHENYSKTGEDAKKGDIVIRKGKVIEPRHIPAIATNGYSKLVVMKRLVVGIIATGDELVEPFETPLPHQIRNSNSYQLSAQVIRAGGVPKYYGIVKDDPEKTEKIVKTAKSECDIILMSGGVSAGDFDFVADSLVKAGFQIIFDSVAVKPGKPTTFAVSDEAICFGMPGNPVSTFVIFEIIVRPFIMKMMNADHKPAHVEMILQNGLKRKRVERKEYVPVKILDSRTVFKPEYHGSGHLTSLADADGIIVIEKGEHEIASGSKVEVLLI
jgi:molybdopterin molybdotransferase